MPGVLVQICLGCFHRSEGASPKRDASRCAARCQLLFQPLHLKPMACTIMPAPHTLPRLLESKTTDLWNSFHRMPLEDFSIVANDPAACAVLTSRLEWAEATASAPQQSKEAFVRAVAAACNLVMVIGMVLSSATTPQVRHSLLFAFYDSPSAVAGMLRTVSCIESKFSIRLAPNTALKREAWHLCTALSVAMVYDDPSSDRGSLGRVLQRMPSALIESAAAAIARVLVQHRDNATTAGESAQANGSAHTRSDLTHILPVALTTLCKQGGACLTVAQQPGFVAMLLQWLSVRDTQSRSGAGVSVWASLQVTRGLMAHPVVRYSCNHLCMYGRRRHASWQQVVCAGMYRAQGISIELPTTCLAFHATTFQATAGYASVHLWASLNTSVTGHSREVFALLPHTCQTLHPQPTDPGSTYRKQAPHP